MHHLRYSLICISSKMIKFTYLILIILFVAYLKLAQLASILPEQSGDLPIVDSVDHNTNGPHHGPQRLTSSQTDDSGRTVTTIVPNTSATYTLLMPQDNNSKSRPTSSTTTTSSSADTTTSPTTTSNDLNADLEELPPSGGGNSSSGSRTTTQNPTINSPNKTPTDNNNNNKPQGEFNNIVEHENRNAELELSVLFYSIFVVYVSFVKLLYHNITIIRRNMTEPGILIIFGIIWELVARQISTRYDVFPRFNLRIFFYLFLPSTVLESASLLSNKWLFFNLLPILIHSIIGTLLFASALGFSIYSLSRQNVFNLSLMTQTSQTNVLHDDNTLSNQTQASSLSAKMYQQDSLDLTQHLNYATSGSSMMQFHNLTLSDCLIFSTILSSVDSNSMLDVLKSYQVNEKLYYLVLGESLMNNAVVLVLFDLLLDFFNATRLTVVKIYIAILQFFTTLIGSVFIGLLLAAIALVSVRLTKRFQPMPNALSSYQNQCQAMVETLLILKLAYLTYTLASLTSTSSILSLATFGILEDQYIKQNLNLRSQLTFRQVILATKTMGFSLVYPLLGMLLVEVANTGQFFLAWLSFEPTTTTTNYPSGASLTIDSHQRSQIIGSPSLATSPSSSMMMMSATSVASSKLSHLANQANLHWNFKFLSIVTVLTIVYRFITVIVLASFSNLLTSGQMRIKFKEQILMAYGGLKGPLAIALVKRLIEHQEYRDKTVRNKHLFTYTILFIIFVSTVLIGSFIRPLVARIQSAIVACSHSADDTSNSTNLGVQTQTNSTIVFDKINGKLSEYVSYGLNSILGHTKSPYDKFVEFNESHIKPWLTRDGSNTNWLCIFYDNLILNETLNSDCFYIATEDPTTMRTFRNQQQRLLLTNRHNRRRSSSSLLDTIDEHLMLGERHISMRGSESNNSIWPSPTTTRRDKINNNTGSKSQNDTRFRHLNAPNGVPEKTLLKEFVMINLRMEEDAERRRQLATNRFDSPTASTNNEDKRHLNPLPSSSKQNTFERMLSTTSSGDLTYGSSSSSNSLDRRAKRDYLNNLEHRFKETKAYKGPEGPKSNSVGANLEPEPVGLLKPKLDGVSMQQQTSTRRTDNANNKVRRVARKSNQPPVNKKHGHRN